MTNTLVLLEPDQFLNEIKKVIKTSLAEHDLETANKDNQHLYTINQISKKLKKSHATVSKWVATGLLKTTASGLISEQSVNDFLTNKNS